MDIVFFPGLKILFLGHGECLLWLNFCRSRGISNLEFPSGVNVRILARPGANLKFLSDKAPSIFAYRPHVIIIHLGMFYLLRCNSDPLSLADRYWHSLGLLISCMRDYFSVRVIFVGQPHLPRAFIPDRMYVERLDTFHSHLLRKAEGSGKFSFLFLGDLIGNISSGRGVMGARLRDLPIYDLPFQLFLSAIKRRVAKCLIPHCKYSFLPFPDVENFGSPSEACSKTIR